MVFEGRLKHGKNVLPDGLNWLCHFAGSSKSYRENSTSFLFLESPHQVDMKKVVKSSKDIFGYFNTLETHTVNKVDLLPSNELKFLSDKVATPGDNEIQQETGA